MGWAALLVAASTWVLYLIRIPPERVDRRPRAFLGSAAIAIIAGLLAGGLVGWAAAVLAGYFWFLTFTSSYRPPDGLQVGDAWPAFVAKQAGGGEVDSRDWSGRRILFKLYRGPW